MSLYRLDRFFAPRSVAIVGATDRPHSMGQALMANMARAGFSGTLYPINPKHRVVGGVKAHARLADLPAPPDLAVIATPGATVPGLVEEAARLGIPATVVISALERDGYEQASGRLAGAVRDKGLRIVGPNCFGVIAPHGGVDASFSSRKTRPGSLALISQSGAIAAALLEWAEVRHIGFSGSSPSATSSTSIPATASTILPPTTGPARSSSTSRPSRTCASSWPRPAPRRAPSRSSC